jgi:hypothetical protein
MITPENRLKVSKEQQKNIDPIGDERCINRRPFYKSFRRRLKVDVNISAIPSLSAILEDLSSD